LNEAITLALKAPRSHARPEAKKRNQQGRAASVTGSGDTDSVELGLLTAAVLSHHQRCQRARELGSALSHQASRGSFCAGHRGPKPLESLDQDFVHGQVLSSKNGFP
jgi:hypothetical protein